MLFLQKSNSLCIKRFVEQLMKVAHKNMAYSESIYKRWSYFDMEDKFEARNTWDSLFKSEKHFLSKLSGLYKSVLDVGSAFGGISEIFELQGHTISYTGIDISSRVINKARVKYPHHSFIAGNFLELELSENFDLVFSTGVCQHEPNYEKLIKRFVELSNKYILFDCKLTIFTESIVDISESYCNYKDPLYFVLIQPSDLIKIFSKVPEISEIEMFGYFTGVHEKVVLPMEVERVCSCHVLLTKKKGWTSPANYILNLPEEVSATINASVESTTEL